MASPDHAATVRESLDELELAAPFPSILASEGRAALDALVADLERVTRERDEARLETSLQMQDKLDAQSLLANICQAIAIDRSDFDLDDTWKTVAQTILARLTEIVDTANRDSERAERAERQRDQAIEALEARWRELLDQAQKGDDEGDHIGFARHYRAKAEGVAEAIKIARDVLASIEKEQT